MKTAVFHGDGDIRVEEVPRPHPGAGEAVIRVTLTTICGTDLHILRGEYPVRAGLVIGRGIRQRAIRRCGGRFRARSHWPLRHRGREINGSIDDYRGRRRSHTSSHGSKMGANAVLDHKEIDVISEVRRLTGGGADVAIEALGLQETFENALRCLRPGGTLSSLGVYSGKLQVPYDAFAAG